MRACLGSDAVAGTAEGKLGILQRFLDHRHALANGALHLVQLLERVGIDLAERNLSGSHRIGQDALTLEAGLLEDAILR